MAQVSAAGIESRGVALSGKVTARGDVKAVDLWMLFGCWTGVTVSSRAGPVTPAILNPRVHSLRRAITLVLGSLALAIPLSHYPRIQRAPLLVIPVVVAMVGTVDTIRCIQRRWSFYHAGVILFVYMDLMTLMLMLFFLLYPYFY